MISLSKIRSSIIDSGKRILKVDQYGAKTALEASSFGDDSNPVKNMSAIYAETQENGEPVIIGYINELQVAGIGEKRIYSLKADGSIGASIWLKNNGNIELNGISDNAVRYQKLDDSLQEMVSGINAELEKIRLGIIASGGTYSKLDVQVTTTDAKIDEIKTS